jgi:hypothetical protein
MDMIGHKTIGPHLHPELAQLLTVLAARICPGYPTDRMADEEQEEAEISVEEAIQEAVRRLVELTRTLAKTTVPDERGWFRNMLVGILISTHANYQAVKAGMPKGPALTCWGARNLLELRVITTYVLRSADDATDFMDDLPADNREFYENLQKSEEFTHKELIAEMRASAAVILAFSRPTIPKFQDAAPVVSSSAVKLMGTHSSLLLRCPGTRGNSKSRGMTPITV